MELVSSSPRLVLVLERDPRVGSLLEERLLGVGLRVQRARTQTQGLRLLRRELPAALYVSELLVGGNAGDLVCLIDRDPRCDALPILTSVQDRQSVWALAMRRGGIQVCRAPIDVDATVTHLDRMTRGLEGGLRALINRTHRLRQRSRELHASLRDAARFAQNTR